MSGVGLTADRNCNKHGMHTAYSFICAKNTMLQVCSSSASDKQLAQLCLLLRYKHTLNMSGLSLQSKTAARTA